MARFILAILTLLSLSALVCVSSGRAKPTARAPRVGPFACTSPGTSTERPNNRPPLHPNGTLVKLSSSPTVYLIDGGRKRAIPSQNILNNLYANGGFNNNDVIVIAQDELNQYSPGSDVSSTMPSNGRGQPEGRLISNGSEVSIVTNGGGRRPFASSSKFQGLGYQFCNAVTLSSADYGSYQPVGMAVGDYPVPSSPQNGGTVQSSTPTLSWSGVAQTSVYRVQIATSLNSLPSSPYFTECFSCVVNTSSSGTSYTPGAGVLASNTQYYWQIQAVNFPDQSVWSAAWSFTTPASPPVIRVAPTSLNFSQASSAPNFRPDSADDPQAPKRSAQESQTGRPTQRRIGEGISGKRGTAVAKSVMNFAELARAQAAAPKPSQEPRFVPEPEEEEEEEEIRDRPVPPGAKVVRQESLSAVPAPLGPSPNASPNFQGVPFTGWYPPDTQGAVGPNHLMVAVNGGVLVQSKTGNDVGFVRSLSSFFSTVADGSADVFDPRIQYDPYGNRWILIASADRESAASAILVGVSQTSDPTGNWNLYRIDVDSSNKTWADFPLLGFNKNWIVVSANMIEIPGTGGIYHARFFVLNKASLYAGGTPSYTQIAAPNNVSGNIVPSSVYDANLSTMYLLQTWSGNTNGSGYLRLYSITGAVGSEVLNNVSSGVFVTTTSPWDSNGGNMAPQLGTPNKIYINDTGIQNVVYRNGSLWCVHTIFLGGSTRSSVQWWQIEPTAPAVQQRGRIDDASGNIFYGYPSIAVNSSNDVLIGYSRFSSTQYAGAGYAFRAGGDAANSLRDDTALKAGAGTYFKVSSTDPFARNRWGDYSGTYVDPADDKAMWTLQEYASSTDTWGTWWGRVTPPGGGAASNTFTIFNDGASTLTVTGISKQNNSSWLSFSPPSPLPFNIAPGASAQVTVSVDASGLAAGSSSDRLLITSNDSSRSPYPDGVNVTLTVTSQPASPPTATAATNVTTTGFNANWGSAGGASGYRLDVSASSTFSGYVSGYQNLDVGNALSAGVSGLSPGTTYYYRVRSYNGAGTSDNSNIVSATTSTQEYTITLNASPADGGTVGGSGTFAAGSSRTVTATPNANYSFSSWTEGGVVVSNSASYNFTLNNNRSLLANFTTNTTPLRIDSVSPPLGQIQGGQQVTLKGSFANLSSVAIGGNTAAINSSSATQIVVTTPAHAVGAVGIVLVPAAGNTYSKSNAFAYLPTSFTDDPPVAGVTQAKAQHVVELRQAVDAMRAVAGLPQAQWTDPTLVNFITPVKAVHIQELRTHLEDAAAALGYSRASYADPNLGASSVVRAVHIQELRQRIKILAVGRL